MLEMYGNDIMGRNPQTHQIYPQPSDSSRRTLKMVTVHPGRSQSPPTHPRLSHKNRGSPRAQIPRQTLLQRSSASSTTESTNPESQHPSPPTHLSSHTPAIQTPTVHCTSPARRTT